MDRFRWCSFPQIDKDYNEKLLIQCNGVRIYENSTKTSYEKGILKVTNCRFIWLDEKDRDGRSISLPLLAVISAKLESPRGFYGTEKLTLILLNNDSLNLAMRGLPSTPNWARTWLDPSLSRSTQIQVSSPQDIINFGFTEGVKFKEVKSLVDEYLIKKEWNYTGAVTRTRFGIADIERCRAAKLGETDSSINKAFEDLDNLMNSAQLMVKISKELSISLIKKKEEGEDLDGSIQELRSQLLSMGIEQVEGFGLDLVQTTNQDSFQVRLAKEISNLALKIITNKNNDNHKIGGCIDLASIYCRINRSRGLDLVSPKDVIKACGIMEKLNLPVVMKKFPSGLLVLHLASENEEETLLATKKFVEDLGCISPGEMSRIIKIAPSLAKERLSNAVDAGHLCIDESIEGTFFYPNKFI